MYNRVAFENVLDFTRGSRAWNRRENGLLMLSETNVPRFEYDFAGAALGLMLEQGETNALLYGDNLSNAAWVKTRCSAVATTTEAPDGYNDAYKLTEDSTPTDTHNVRQDTAVIPPTVASTVTVFVKAGGRTRFRLRIEEASANRLEANFDLTAGTVVSVTNVGTATGAAATIQAWANGWYRCCLSGIPSTTGTTARVTISLQDAAGSVTYSGDGTSGLYLWRASLVTGLLTRSSIESVETTIARASENCAASLTGADWFLPDGPGTLFVQALRGADDDSTNQYLATLHDGTNDNRVSIRASLTNSGATSLIVVGATTVANISTTTGFANGAVGKIALAWDEDDVAFYVGGSAGTPDTNAAIPPGLTTLTLGLITSQRPDTTRIQKLKYYPRRMLNADLAALTT